jgi:DNA-binding NarL/FixJ family response regulator
VEATARGSRVQDRELLARSGQLRVVIADNHTSYRLGLAKLLTSFGIEVVGEASNGSAAIQSVEATSPDVVLMDPGMHGLSGIEATRRLTEQGSSSRVLVLSVSVDEDDVTGAILAGAAGYLLKDEPLDEITAAIRATAFGQSHISPTVAAVLLRRIRGAIEAGDGLAGGGLSGRDLEVLDERACGKDEHEIAEALGISPVAVRHHTSSILTKLQVEARVRASVGAVGDRPAGAVA